MELIQALSFFTCVDLRRPIQDDDAMGGSKRDPRVWKHEEQLQYG
jgi:hypothetical protein